MYMKYRKTAIFCLFIFISVFLCGCATMPSRGSSAQDQRIKESGMATDVKPQGNILFPGPLQVTEKRANFKTSDEKAVWWCQFYASNFFAPPRMTIKWYSPDGKLYKEEKVGGFAISEAIRAELPIRGTPVASMEGKWKVEVYYTGKLFDQVWFVIGEQKESKQMGED